MDADSALTNPTYNVTPSSALSVQYSSLGPPGDTPTPGRPPAGSQEDEGAAYEVPLETLQRERVRGSPYEVPLPTESTLTPVPSEEATGGVDYEVPVQSMKMNNKTSQLH